jgi:hypothetical protein
MFTFHLKVNDIVRCVCTQQPPPETKHILRKDLSVVDGINNTTVKSAEYEPGVGVQTILKNLVRGHLLTQRNVEWEPVTTELVKKEMVVPSLLNNGLT